MTRKQVIGLLDGIIFNKGLIQDETVGKSLHREIVRLIDEIYIERKARKYVKGKGLLGTYHSVIPELKNAYYERVKYDEVIEL